MEEKIIVSTYRCSSDGDLVICKHKTNEAAIKWLATKDGVIDWMEMPRIKTVSTGNKVS